MLEALCVEDRDAVFVQNPFPWPNRNLSPGWVSAIVNAFAILGNIKMMEVAPGPEVARLTRRMADAYLLAHAEGEPPSGRWITYVDRGSNVWFDEYPQPDGEATLVLNGHIFAIHALYEAASHFSDERYLALATAGISTLRKTLPRFRCRGMRNHYSLRGIQRPDYLPIRTVKQQLELYKLTGDEFFRRMARRFRKDMSADFSAADNDHLETLEAKLRSRATKKRREGSAVGLIAGRVGLPLRTSIASWSEIWRARKDSNLRPPDS
ncbi:MAG: D-glucuronyl C5-epimerase family protein [Sphingomonadales bacterium]|nr:D-glucuronyl C5-epimerase family protein [Sphingomonadales bacterium]